MGEHERWVVEQSTEGLNVPVEKALGVFSPDEMVVKWCGGLKYNDGVAVGWESSGLADSESDVAKYRGVDDEDDYLLVRAAMGDEDRKGDVIVPSGWVLDGYRQNPVILWAHDRTLPPIGRSHRVWTDEKGLIAEVEFAQTKLAQDVAGLYRTGFMRNVVKVEIGKERNEQFKLGVYTMLAGAAIALFGLLIGDVGGTLVALFGLAIIGGIVNWRRRFFSPFFVVVITTSSQPELFVRTQDAEFAVRVQNAINDAWASAP